jgi:hypothetical protein
MEEVMKTSLNIVAIAALLCINATPVHAVITKGDVQKVCLAVAQMCLSTCKIKASSGPNPNGFSAQLAQGLCNDQCGENYGNCMQDVSVGRAAGGQSFELDDQGNTPKTKKVRKPKIKN